MERFGPLSVETFTDELFGENSYLVWRQGEPDAWIIDPGLPPSPEQIVAAVRANGLIRLAIVLTHAHADHIAGIGPLRERLGDVPVVCPHDEAPLLTSAEANLSASMGMPITAPPADDLVRPGETIALCDLVFEILDVAGHSPGGVAYYNADAGVAFVGDALFAEGIGRYDFPHSDRTRLLANIEQNLLSLPDETMILPGHGPPAPLGQIKVSNMTLISELSHGA